MGPLFFVIDPACVVLIERKCAIITVYAYRFLETFTKDTLMVSDYKLIVTDGEHFIGLRFQTMLHLNEPVHIFWFLFESRWHQKKHKLLYIPAPFVKVEAVYFKTLIIPDLVAD